MAIPMTTYGQVANYGHRKRNRRAVKLNSCRPLQQSKAVNSDSKSCLAAHTELARRLQCQGMA